GRARRTRRYASSSISFRVGVPGRGGGPFGGAQAGGAGARVGGDLGGGRPDRLAVEQGESGLPPLAFRGEVTRSARSGATAGPEKLLDPPVFERVERDGGEAAAGTQKDFGRLQ